VQSDRNPDCAVSQSPGLFYCKIGKCRAGAMPALRATKKPQQGGAGASRNLRHYNRTLGMLSVFVSRIKSTCDIVPIDYTMELLWVF
jgi:hypothetical protein